MPAPGRRFTVGRVWLIVALAIVTGLVGAGIWAAKKWPFTREAVTRTLEKHLKRRVSIGRFRKTWFPPGCVAADVRVASMMDARDVVIETTWPGLLSRHIAKVKIVGLRIIIAPSTTSAIDTGGKSEFSGIGEIEANEAVVEFPPRTASAQKSVIQIHQLVLEHLAAGRTASFRASLKSDKPAGEFNTSGQVGPWNLSDPASTPLSGIYQFNQADLSVFHGLRGILSSRGRFEGNLSKIGTQGDVQVPDFHVDGSAHKVHLTASFRASIDAQTADTILESVRATVGRTVILGTGNVSGGEGTDGKTARLEMTIDNGRLEDLLNYFSDEKRATMTGAIKLRAYVELPPGPGFLAKVRLNGDFGVGAAKFTNPARQTPVNRLSESAAGEKKDRQEEDPRTVMSNLKGHVVVRHGVASLTNLSFEFPGAIAEMNGAYNLIPKTVAIHGTLRTTGSLSDTSTGIKALMLKVATPFLKKHKTTVIPFTMTGAASNPTILPGL